jgi:hypothetical protein
MEIAISSQSLDAATRKTGGYMIISTQPPMIYQIYSAHLLSLPSIRKFNADYLLKIAQWLEKKILSAEFRNFPNTVLKLKQQQHQFMELYDQVKTKEKESEGKTYVKANFPFYFPKLVDKNDQRIFEELDDRRKTSMRNRRNNGIPKI